MNIKNVNLEIKSYENEGFGFNFDFKSGLNLLTGHNSSGKSTVLSCIYYCLGLEQLIGSKGPKTLSPAIRESFNFEGKTYQVFSSSCKLTIKANDGNIYVLTRVIKDAENNESLNKEIIIEDSKGNKFGKYVHATRDHDEHGFYRWLAEVNSLEILESEQDGGKISKSLYMQNIFSLSFIEQTKGWSDFFSMLPSFGIKDIKQKIVEYCLNLNSLESRLKLDEISTKTDENKRIWKDILSTLNQQLTQLNFYVPTLNKTKILDVKKIQNLKPILILENKEISVENYLEDLKIKINYIEKSIDLSSKSFDENNKNLLQKEALITSIKSYEEEHLKVFDLMDQEQEKQKKFSNLLSETNEDLKDFQDIKWISTNRNWEKLSNSKCPVCEQGLAKISSNSINDENVAKTSQFLKSQKELYESYISASYNLIQKYRSALDFYTKKIKNKRKELDYFSKDITTPSVLAIRTEMQNLAALNQRQLTVEEFIVHFEIIKHNLKELSIKHFDLLEQERVIKELLEEDDTTIMEFEKLFITYLNTYGYRSNSTKYIHITNKGNYPLIPQISLHGQESQNIRFISSASDFVRSIWAYYMSLLVLGKRHPGFLVMDEPGQHQMRVDSLKCLLASAVGSGKQVLMAISQDRKIDDKKVNIRELLNELGEEEYHYLHIEDSDGCVVRKG
ncbi:hypothetical protein ACRN94_03670 [Shewanella baltica]|uniref:hypothetical protein n=1 Tax=Shewanella baltica TaxID=62322 RepID=UPI003D78C558